MLLRLHQSLQFQDHNKQRMLDNLAHEMRTPLTAIHGYAEYICSAKIPDEERVDAAKYIMSESMRLKDISEVLLDSAFIRENGINPKDITPVIADYARSYFGNIQK